ncbi:MAG: FMN-binding protein, partial [Polyangiales bacterium]
HEPISFGTFFDPQGVITRVEILAYREPYGDGVRAERFRKQFLGRSAKSTFRPGADIDAISGATISSRSLCIGVERAAVLFDVAQRAAALR